MVALTSREESRTVLTTAWSGPTSVTSPTTSLSEVMAHMPTLMPDFSPRLTVTVLVQSLELQEMM